MYKQVELGGFAGMCIVGPLIGAIRGRSLTAVLKAARTVLTNSTKHQTILPFNFNILCPTDPSAVLSSKPARNAVRYLEHEQFLVF